MYCVIYLFQLKEGKEIEFKTTWSAFTTLLYETANSLGSRLHKKEDLSYIAYAQWPDKETFDNARNILSQEALSLRDDMRATCKNVEVLMDLDVEVDLTKSKIFSLEN